MAWGIFETKEKSVQPEFVSKYQNESSTPEVTKAKSKEIVKIDMSLFQTHIPDKTIEVFNGILTSGQEISDWAKFELGLAYRNDRQDPEDRKIFVDQIDKVDWESFSRLPIREDMILLAQIYDAFHVCRKTKNLPAENKWGITSYRERTDNPFDTYPGLKPPANEDIQKYVVSFFTKFYKPEFK